MTAAGGRHAAYGDALARLLEFRGHDVHARVLRQRLRHPGPPARRVDRTPARAARSRPRTATRATTSPSSPSGSRTPRTDDVDDRRRARRRAAARADPRVDARDPRRLRRLVLRALAARRATRRRSSTPSSELEERGETYRDEGALWLRTTAHGDDKDRVLERSTGEHTYFASDIAYHLDKRERGFDRLIDVLGRRPPRLRRRG